MAATGQMMILFIILHALGNSTVFFSGLNAYAAGLHAFPISVLLRLARIVLISTALLHVFYAVQLKLENNDAKPEKYFIKSSLAATFAGKTMIWTGSVIGVFIVYHLLHFTFQVTNPSISAMHNMDASGRPDVFLMVTRSFQNGGIAAAYLSGILALYFHLSHGIQSSFQTLGLNCGSSFSYIQKGSLTAAIILFLLYSSIPLAALFGILK